MKTANQSIECLNCHAQLSPDQAHCHQCGQSVKEARLTLSALFSEFLSNLFNVDGRILRTIRHMWKPAYLTQQYVAGKRKSYFNPVRFFLVMLIIQFFMINYTVSHSNLNLNSDAFRILLNNSRKANAFDTLAPKLIPQAEVIQLDTLRKSLYGNSNKADKLLLFGGSKKSITRDTSKKKGLKVDYNFVEEIGRYQILKKDAVELSTDSLFAKYGVEKRMHQHAIKQFIRIDNNRESGLLFVIGNLTWAVVISMLLIAAVAYILYIRNGYYYIEHAVLQLYFHAKALLLINIIMAMLMILGDNWIDVERSSTSLSLSPDDIYSYLGIFVLVYYFLTFKLYYQQGWIKTFIKFFCILLSYILILAFLTMCIVLVGAALY